jgi:1,3-beta-glucan synthase
VIAIVGIQRAIQKILIAVFLTREFKHDETNRAWWTGQWYGRGLGNSAISQPAREFVVKIVEMSLWSSDFLLAHILLVILTVPLFIPWFDRIQSTMLCKSSSLVDPPSLTVVSAVWLRPSKQIRAPLFSTKQKRQRRWMVFKYSVVYLVVVAGLAALIALRESPMTRPCIAWMLTLFAAAIFRDRLKFSCSVCRNI